MTSIDKNASDALNSDELNKVVGGVASTAPVDPLKEGEVAPPPEGEAPLPPPGGPGSFTPPGGPGSFTPPGGPGSFTPPGGHGPFVPPAGAGPFTPPGGGEVGGPMVGGELTPPMFGDGPPEGVCPPPHPDGYVNGFIAPLYEGLTYVEGGESSWTLAIDPSDVNSEDFTFVVSADQVGEWEGGLPPEATDNGDGTYTIQCWPFDSVTDNGDGTVTLGGLMIGPMAGGGEEEGEPPADGSETAASVTPPHPEGDVNDFIEPLYDGLNYVEGGVSTWTLPIGVGSVDATGNTFTVPADELGDPSFMGGEVTDNGDGTYTISCWPISGVVDNGDGTVTLSVDIGPMAA